MHLDLNMNLLAAAGWLTTLVLGMLSVIQARKNFALSKRVADSGVLRRPNIELIAFDSDHDRSNQFDEFLIACHLKRDGFFHFPFKITVRNTGDKSAKGIRLLIRFPKLVHSKHKEYTSAYPQMDFAKIHSLDEGNFQIALVQLKDLSPGESLGFVDTLTLKRPSLYGIEVPVVSKDGVKMNAHVKTLMNFILDYTVYQEDFPPVAGRCGFVVIDLSEKPLPEALRDYNDFCRNAAGEVERKRIRAFVCETKEGNATNRKKFAAAKPPFTIFDGIQDADGCVYFKGVNMALSSSAVE